MTIFLILAPFGAFALLMLVTSAQISLFASAAICLAVIGIDVYRGRSIKVLGAGCVVLFAGLGAYVTLVDPSMSHSAVKLTIDVGVLAISLASLIIGNVLTIYVPGLPLWSSLVIAFAARNSAAYFTTWYPQYRKAKYGAPPANALPGTN